MSHIKSERILKSFDFKDIYYWICLVVIFAYLAPYGVPSLQKFHIHDNLDSNYVWYKLLIDTSTIFASSNYRIPEILNGIPRSALPSEFDAIVWLYYYLGPVGAYVSNRILVTVVAFVGMYHLLVNHVIRDEADEHIALGVSLCFSILPFYPLAGLSIAGMPVLFNAILNFKNRRGVWTDWLWLVIYPFYSSLVWCGFFVIASVWAWWLYSSLVERRISKIYLPLITYTLISAIFNYRMIGDFLFKSYVSHRIEFASTGDAGIMLAIWETFKLATYGDFNTYSLQTLIIIPTVVLSFFKYKSLNLRIDRLHLYLVIFLVVTSLWYGMNLWDGLASYKSYLFGMIPIQLQRFYWLHPVIWFVLFAISLSLLRKSHIKRNIIIIIISVQIIYSFAWHELFRNRSKPTVSEFFAEEQFNSVARHIGESKDSYKVASLGIHPSIAQFNGFSTLDGYFVSYPLDYKKSFRVIIAGELNRSVELRTYFDNWGSRIYLFSKDLKDNGKYVMNRSGNTFLVKELNYDLDAFRALGGRYIISAVRIDPSINTHLLLDRIFKDDNSAWDLYLYKIL